MRLLLALSLLCGCVDEPGDSGPYVGGGDGPGSMPYDDCRQDADCSSELVCARDGQCLSPSEVRATHTRWTVSGQPAGDASCANAPLLSISFDGGGDEHVGYAPVPCDAGIFTVDKLPSWYLVVSLRREGDEGGGSSASFDADGNANIDLPY